MVCSGHSFPSHTFPAFILEVQKCRAELCYPVANRSRTLNLVMKHNTEWNKGHHDLLHLWQTQHLSQYHMEMKLKQLLLPPLNSLEDLNKTSSDHSKGIHHFPRSYHMTFTKEVFYIYVDPGTWQARWASLNMYSWKANDQLCMFLYPKPSTGTIIKYNW